MFLKFNRKFGLLGSCPKKNAELGGGRRMVLWF